MTPVAWPFLPAHTDAFIRLQRTLTEVQGFMLCFLVFSDSAYRNKVVQFLADHLDARLHVTIDQNEPIGTEELFTRLNQGPANHPVQLSGLEHWPAGLDNLLVRLNLRREALADRCPRPVLVWTLSTQLNTVATEAADLWAWRSGTFQFALSKRPPPSQALTYSRFFSLSDAEVDKRRRRIADLQGYLATVRVVVTRDVDLLRELAELRLSLCDVAGAEAAYAEAQDACWRIRDERLSALVECGMADILEARGQLPQALRLREEQVGVFSAARDLRAEALNQRKIADLLLASGRFSETLDILDGQVVPAYERLQDMRSKAIALGGVAHVHLMAARYEEALRIHREERLPVFQRLGEQRLCAHVHDKMADILLARGQFDEALRTRKEQELMLYHQLGDVHASTVAQSKIGDIHRARGELDEALRIRTEVQLPTFERLQDHRSTAITHGQIATIWQSRGQPEQARHICVEEELPLYDLIGERHCKAIALGRLADILQELGRLEEALAKRRDEELPIYCELGDVRAYGIAQGKVADLLDQLGRSDEALEVRASAEYPIDEAYGAASQDGFPRYMPYERGGVLYESELADEVAGTYRSHPVEAVDWTARP